LKVGYVRGTCRECGRTYTAQGPAAPVLCDCYQYCPLCGNKMTPYVPDLTPGLYWSDPAKDMRTLFACNNHTPPYYSKQRPVEVMLS